MGKEERAAQARFAKKVRGDAHGMASFLIRADVATIEAIDAAVTTRAARLAETMPESAEDERRVHAVLRTVTGAADETDSAELLPQVHLHVPTYAGPDSESVARVEGHGPVTEEWVRQVLGPVARFRIQPVLDLVPTPPASLVGCRSTTPSPTTRAVPAGWATTGR